MVVAKVGCCGKVLRLERPHVVPGTAWARHPPFKVGIVGHAEVPLQGARGTPWSAHWLDFPDRGLLLVGGK